MGNGSQGGAGLLTAIVALVALTGAAFAECKPDKIDLRGSWGSAGFTVEVADDNAERAQGLMHRERMASSAGMLFVYPQPRTVRFWMRNTLISLDMIFADARGVVQKVHHEAVPLDTTLIPGGDNIQYVLEINGGLAKQFGIGPGTVLRHPSIPSDVAVWACDAKQ